MNHQLGETQFGSDALNGRQASLFSKIDTLKKYTLRTVSDERSSILFTKIFRNYESLCLELFHYNSLVQNHVRCILFLVPILECFQQKQIR